MSRLTSAEQIRIPHEGQLLGPEELQIGLHIGHIAVVAETPLRERTALAALVLSGLGPRVAGQGRLAAARAALREGDDLTLYPQWHGTISWTDGDAVAVDLAAQLPEHGGSRYANRDLSELPPLERPTRHLTYADSLGLAQIGTHIPIADGFQGEAGRWYYAATVAMPVE